MNTLAKIVIPAVLSIAAFSASAAGTGQIPSYGEAPVVVGANPTAAAAAAGAQAGGAASIRGEASAAQPQAPSRAGLTRAEVRREAAAAKRAAVGVDPFFHGYINN